MDGQLYMRVGDAITYAIAPGHAVTYVGMTPDGSKVYFTSSDQLTSADTDSSVDLYLWSEATKELTLISKGNDGAGNSDTCDASWVSQCNVSVFEGLALAEVQGGFGGNGVYQTTSSPKTATSTSSPPNNWTVNGALRQRTSMITAMQGPFVASSIRAPVALARVTNRAHIAVRALS